MIEKSGQKDDNLLNSILPLALLGGDNKNHVNVLPVRNRQKVDPLVWAQAAPAGTQVRNIFQTATALIDYRDPAGIILACLPIDIAGCFIQFPKFNVIKAQYGFFPINAQPSGCSVIDVTSVMQTYLDGRNSVNFENPLNFLAALGVITDGNPCPDYKKFLQIVYQCVGSCA